MPARGAPPEDAEPFAAGRSVREYGGRKYEIVVPQDLDRSKRYSLILAVSTNGRDDVAGSFAELAVDGWITCGPKTKYTNKGAGENWATNEAPELLELVDHLTEVLPIDKRRLHVVAVTDWAGFVPFVAFSKDAHFASVTFSGRCAFRGGSPPPRARTELGVLVLRDTPLAELPADERIAPALEGKVRSVEFRHDTSDPAAPYPAYWRGVMEGRFVPGVDLSLPWREPTNRDEVTAPLAAGKQPGLLYFFSQQDASNAAAKSFQNEVLFDPDVREAAASFLALKLDRAAFEPLFQELGLKTTPAVVAVDGSIHPLGKLEGKIPVSAARKFLREFAPHSSAKH